MGAGVGMGIAGAGAALGIGWLSAKTLEGIARQPEASGKLTTTMLIAIAFVESIALYALVVCLILATKG